MDWDKLKIFHAVAEAGSFTRAAARLNVSQSALSRQIKGLEDELNTALFTRHARGLVLTQEGERLFEAAHKAGREIEDAEQALLESKEQPKGRLKITTTVAFGTFWLTPHLKDFIRQFPDIKAELYLTDRDVDLASGEAELAIRFHPPAQADLIQKPLMIIHQHIYATAGYLNQRGSPERVEDLDNHDLVVYGPMDQSPHLEVDWILRAGKPKAPRQPKLQINSHFGVLQAIRAGVGLGSLPDYLAGAHPELVRVLGDTQGPSFKAYFVYPGELKRSKRVTEFRDYLVKKLARAAGGF